MPTYRVSSTRITLEGSVGQQTIIDSVTTFWETDDREALARVKALAVNELHKPDPWGNPANFSVTGLERVDQEEKTTVIPF